MNATSPVAARTELLPRASATARDRLTDRVLTVTNADNAPAIVRELDPTHEGLVLTGAKRHSTMKRLRRAYPNLLVMAEPDAHSELEAAPDEYWHLPAHDDDGLFPAPTVEEILAAQRDAGATIAILPAGFIGSGDQETLLAMVTAANAIPGEDIALPFYLAGGWLRAEHRGFLQAAIKKSRHPVLLSFGSSTNPLDSANKVKAYLDIAAVGAFCWRTDLAGLAAVSRGALGAAIGTGPAQRRITPPQDKGKARRPQDRTPYVLIPTTMHWMKTGAMREGLFVGVDAPDCVCRECGSRKVDRFSEGQADAAARHNHALIDAYFQTLLALPENERAAVWSSMAREALVAHEVVAGSIGRPWRAPDDVAVFAEG